MTRLARIQRPSVGLGLFVALVTLAHLLMFQGPLLSYALRVVDTGHWDGVVDLVSLQMLQICLMVFLLCLSAMAGQVALKSLVSVLFLVNSLALYFIETYGIVLDHTMIGNILNTDQNEAGDLFHPQMLSYVLGLGVLPVLAVWSVRIRLPRWFWKLGSAMVSVAILLGWVFATSFTWPWFDQHGGSLGGRVLPWSYIVNTARYFNRAALRDREQVLLPDATFKDTPERRQIVVLVMGEAARAEDLGYYGYARDTTPFTRDKGFVVFPAGQSCATYTIASTACILTHEGRQASPWTVFEPLPSYTQRMGIETLYRTNNYGPPPVVTDEYVSLRTMAPPCTVDNCPNKPYDEALLIGLEDKLKASDSKRIFVTLHLQGSHGPAYWKRYPPEFQVFEPVCETVQVSECSHEELVNAYDNSIRYTDYVMAEVIGMLEGMDEADSTLIYVPDHGQSLGEDGFYLHGAPLAVAPEQQRRIPFMVWMSDGFMASRGLSRESILRDKTFPHDFPFHSVMGAFGMQSPIYKPEYDVFSGPAPSGG